MLSISNDVDGAAKVWPVQAFNAKLALVLDRAIKTRIQDFYDQSGKKHVVTVSNTSVLVRRYLMSGTYHNVFWPCWALLNTTEEEQHAQYDMCIKFIIMAINDPEYPKRVTRNPDWYRKVRPTHDFVP